MILETLLLSGPSFSLVSVCIPVLFSWWGACVHAMNPHRFQHPTPRGLSHEDIWLSVVKFPDIVIIHRGWSERKYHCNYTTWTPKHVHTFIFIRTHTHIHTHTHACMHAHTHAHTCTEAHPQMHTLSNVHTRAHTHTHTSAICCIHNYTCRQTGVKEGILVEISHTWW